MFQRNKKIEYPIFFPKQHVLWNYALFTSLQIHSIWHDFHLLAPITADRKSPNCKNYPPSPGGFSLFRTRNSFHIFVPPWEGGGGSPCAPSLSPVLLRCLQAHWRRKHGSDQPHAGGHLRTSWLAPARRAKCKNCAPPGRVETGSHPSVFQRTMPRIPLRIISSQAFIH